jgi:hypothetical protein
VHGHLAQEAAVRPLQNIPRESQEASPKQGAAAQEPPLEIYDKAFSIHFRTYNPLWSPELLPSCHSTLNNHIEHSKFCKHEQQRTRKSGEMHVAVTLSQEASRI